MSPIIKTLALLAVLATSTAAAAVGPANPQAPLITSAPSLATAFSVSNINENNNNAGCAGLVVTDDLSMPEPYCCVGGVYAVAPFPLTKWFYNHTGVRIPSTVITPTTCVRPVPMTAVPTAGV